MPIHMVGGTPTIQARLGDLDMLCVVDSGSTVSRFLEEETPANLWAHEERRADANPSFSKWARDSIPRLPGTDCRG